MTSSSPKSLLSSVKSPPVSCSLCCHAQRAPGSAELRLGTSQRLQSLQRIEMANHVPLVSRYYGLKCNFSPVGLCALRKRESSGFFNFQSVTYISQCVSWHHTSLCRRGPGVSQTSLSKRSADHSRRRRQWWWHLYGFLHASLKGRSSNHGSHPG